MTILKIPKKEIEKIIELNEENIEKINLMGIPIESINEDEIEFEVLPNRPDVLSKQGYIRALKYFFEKENELKKYKVKKPKKEYKVKIDNSLKNIRPFTACAIVKGIEFNDEKIKEIIDIQEKLHLTIGRNRKKIAIGIYPIEKISLPIKFEAKKPNEIRFVPLGMSEELNGIQILQRHLTGREYGHLLKNLEKFPVFIDSTNRILSMPPIINSNETGKITEETREVFIECSGFEFDILKKTLNIIVCALADMGGEIYQMILDYNGKEILTPDLRFEVRKLSLKNVNRLLGVELKEGEIKSLLKRMGHEYDKGKVKVSPYRTDIMHEVDLIEDIAIAYGYNKLVPEIPKVATIGEESFESKITRKISEILIGLGFVECVSYHLIKTDEAKMIKEKIEIENSKTDYKYLRPNLLIPSLRIISENKDNEYPQKIFEIGTTFKIDKSEENGIKESEHLIVTLAPGNFTEIKQVLEYLGRMLKIDFCLIESENEWMIEGRTGEIRIKEKEIGHIGEIHPRILKDSKIRMPVSLFEIDLEEIFNLMKT